MGKRRRVINVSTAWNKCSRPWERSFGGGKPQGLKPYSIQVQVQVQVLSEDKVLNRMNSSLLSIKCRKCRLSLSIPYHEYVMSRA